MIAKYSKMVGLFAGACALFAVQAPSTASAHISLEKAGTHKSRYGDSFIKEGVCGKKIEARGTNIYTYEPGETITIKVMETVPHPGYFRIAFDDDGIDDFKDPVSIKPVVPTRKCPFDQFDRCTKSDFYNTKAVLPGMDNLFPHTGGLAALNKVYDFKVQLPDVECTNCTIQIIQVMEDTVHGAYNTQGEDNSLEDVYHTCIDVVLKRKGGARADAGTKADAAVKADAGVTADAGDPGTGSSDAVEDEEDSDTLAEMHDHEGGASASEGCSLAGNGSRAASAAWLLVGLGALVARNRKRRREGQGARRAG